MELKLPPVPSHQPRRWMSRITWQSAWASTSGTWLVVVGKVI
jgi:hypothetical protein